MFVGSLSADEWKHDDLTNHQVPPIHIHLSLQERDPKNDTQFTPKYKHKSKLQKESSGHRTEIQYLCKLIEDANYVYWSRRRYESDVVRHVFWTHPNLVKLMNIFPIVLIMNTTQTINKYRQPMFEIVGVMSIELTFFIAFTYIKYVLG